MLRIHGGNDSDQLMAEKGGGIRIMDESTPGHKSTAITQSSHQSTPISSLFNWSAEWSPWSRRGWCSNFERL